MATAADEIELDASPMQQLLKRQSVSPLGPVRSAALRDRITDAQDSNAFRGMGGKALNSQERHCNRQRAA